MLEKPEEKEFHKKWESLYVFTGRRSDLTTMISIAVINPMILYVFIGYVAGKRISLPVLYLIIDGVLFLQWGLLVKRRKRKIEQSIQDVAGQMDTGIRRSEVLPPCCNLTLRPLRYTFCFLRSVLRSPAALRPPPHRNVPLVRSDNRLTVF